jgi:hypothetical protein
VVADAGPLIALAKIGALPVLFSQFPETLIPPAVHLEAVLHGTRSHAPDAALLAERCEAAEIKVVAPADPSPFESSPLGLGER